MNEELLMQAQVNPILDRRQTAPEHSVWWNKLSLAQKFSASSLGKFGYEIAFIRKEQGQNIAVLTCDSGVAVITEDGDINTNPDIQIRD
ncbi:MAG: hypothetical protein ACJAXJ_002501 [Colwellia sp.]|jgi:hypothetical protein